MHQNFILTIEYDGSGFHGWQRQKEDRTIQEEIEKALTMITDQKIILTGSGRTDAGVHALAQTANFKCNTLLSAETLQKGLNSLLPKDIVILSCNTVSHDFHARFDATSKRYRYHILNDPFGSAIGRHYIWHIRKKLNATAMQAAARHLVGEHNFKSFEGAGSPRDHSIRTVMDTAFFPKENNRLIFEIEATGFLRFMVRNIVGTLADVGLGKITPDEFKTILQAKDRNCAGPTAPPQGLFLVEVKYEGTLLDPRHGV